MIKKIDVILVDPFLNTIIKTEIDDSLESLQHSIGDHYIEMVAIDDEDIMYVDGEGLYRENQEFFVLHYEGFKVPLAGKAVILGNDMINGKTIGTKSNVTDFIGRITFHHKVELQQMAERGEFTPK